MILMLAPRPQYLITLWEGVNWLHHHWYRIVVVTLIASEYLGDPTKKSAVFKG